MMEGRDGYFPLALKAAMTHVQESCTLPKGFPCAAYKLPDRRGNYFTFHLLLFTHNHPFQTKRAVICSCFTPSGALLQRILLNFSKCCHLFAGLQHGEV